MTVHMYIFWGKSSMYVHFKCGPPSLLQDIKLQCRHLNLLFSLGGNTVVENEIVILIVHLKKFQTMYSAHPYVFLILVTSALRNPNLPLKKNLNTYVF